tara:strand:+ start:1909 stop:2715 length:807 start_codon:yes stop_codon:yes gene_type:complete
MKQKKKKLKEKSISIPIEITEDLAYLCGVLAGDGNINFRQEKYEYSLKCVGNPQNEKSFYFNIVGPKFKKVFGFTPNIRYFDSQTTFGFVVFSKKVVNYLTQFVGLPLGKKYDKLKIPKIFLGDQKLLISFIRGVFDTDGCMCFKKRYRNYPYYPVISFSSKSKSFTKEIANILKKLNFKLVELYDYQMKDERVKKGLTIINRLELNGENNLCLWMKKIGFFNLKNLDKIKKYGKSKMIAGGRFELPTYTRKNSLGVSRQFMSPIRKL